MILTQLMIIVPIITEINSIPIILLESGVMLPPMNLIHTQIIIDKRVSLIIDSIAESLEE